MGDSVKSVKCAPSARPKSARQAADALTALAQVREAPPRPSSAPRLLWRPHQQQRLSSLGVSSLKTVGRFSDKIKIAESNKTPLNRGTASSPFVSLA